MVLGDLDEDRGALLSELTQFMKENGDEAVFPTGPDPDKYWPPVARIDQAYGDRHLVCACPPPEAFAEKD